MENVQRSMPERSNSLDYFEWCRDDVIGLVPTEAKKILSVGCAQGVTESVLVRQGKSVLGIEIDSAAAQVARENGLEVIEGDVQSAGAKLTGRKFDCIIYADVLEHTPNPEMILKEHLALLSPGGTIIISVPNFRHYSVFRALLLQGEFQYQSSGIFDRTHVRITTRKAVIRWVKELGMGVVRTNSIIYRRRYRLMSLLTLGLLDEFLAYQIVVVAIDKRSRSGEDSV